jgi:hypothetical protein
VLVVTTTTAARPQRRRVGRRALPAAGAAPTVDIGRATLIAADPLDIDAETWLRAHDVEAEVAAALATMNRVIDVHRIAAADPAAPPLTRAACLLVRVGTGAGDQVAHGRWHHAVAVGPPPPGDRPDRTAVLRPQERLGAVLAGRDVALACELLTLRARADADAGRWREAAFQLRVALEAVLAELLPWSGQADIDDRLAELRTLRGAVGDAANAALQGGLDAAQVADVVRVLERVEAALRARTHAELS